MNSSVFRLEAWKKMEEELEEEVKILRVLTNPHRNSRDLRAAMEEATVCLPYVNVFLRDLIFCHDGNQSYKVPTPSSSPDLSDRGEERINKRKAELTAGIIRNVTRLSKKATHNIPAHDELQQLLRRCPALSGSQLDQASRWVEPRDKVRPDKPDWVISAISTPIAGVDRAEKQKRRRLLMFVFILVLSIICGSFLR